MRVGVDIGGTFTDVVFCEDGEGGLISHAKALTQPGSLALGVRAALHKAKVDLGSAGILIHGSTVVINAIIERKGSKTALVTTQGFRDVYEIGRINRPDSFNPRFRKHRPLIPREHIFEINERILEDGTEFAPLDPLEAETLANKIAEEGYDSVAIVFLHSYRESNHELQMARILKERNPRVFVTCSHELSREYREYERTSTVAANAYVGPIVNGYLTELVSIMNEDGFSGELLIMQSNGGLAEVEVAKNQCIQMMESGPAGGVVGVMSFCEDLGIDEAIAFDMGGTTAKSCVVQRGRPGISHDTFVGGYNEGLVIRIPVLNIVEVGTGGGSIAWLDEGSGLHVGPRSAGASPGPACYGRGGLEPTITDANVVLGRLAADEFLSGEMTLDRSAAEEALMRNVATPLGVSLVRAASGILEVAGTIMANNVKEVTLQRGIDPRSFTLFAYGGGGPLHASTVAKELKISTVVIPRLAGVFSALGMLVADLRRDYVQTIFHRLDEVDLKELEAMLGQLESTGERELKASGQHGAAVIFERAADMRYVGQEHAVTVRLPNEINLESDREFIKQQFDAAHQQQYNHNAPRESAEIVSLRVTAVGMLNKPKFVEPQVGEKEVPGSAKRGFRSVWFRAGGYQDTQVYGREDLLAGNVILGPAIIAELTSTTVVEPNDVVSVDLQGNLVMTLGAL